MQKYQREPEAISNNILERMEASEVYTSSQYSEENGENLNFKPLKPIGYQDNWKQIWMKI